MKKIIILITLMLLMSSCAKKVGSTSSKIRIISGNIQALMSEKANNGLLLYGKSADGKTFTTRITGDSVDLVFPNGVWNFYAISWEVPQVGLQTLGTLPDFTGNTHCGKLLAQNLTGTDVNLTLNLANSNCNDPAFSANTKYNNSPTPAIYELPTADFLTCKNLSPVTGTKELTVCNQFNKGYATSYRVVAYESKNFGTVTPRVKIAQSMCAETSSGDDGFLGGSSFNIRVPTTLGNGFSLEVEIFYAGSCDGSRGIDVIAFNDNPRLKTIVDASVTPAKYYLHVKSDAANVCVPGPRKEPTSFAVGDGTSRPYGICTKEQFNNISTGANFGSNKNNSFVLLADLNFNFGQFVPIGESVDGNANPTDSFTGNFDGGDKRLDNIKLPCENFSSSAANTNFSMGIFRKTSGSIISNFTVNKIVADCKDKKVQKVGAIVGDATNTTLSNINIFGIISAEKAVGGAVGSYTLTSLATALKSLISSINAEVNVDGVQQIGGLVGYYSSLATVVHKIFQSSVKGKLHSRLKGGSNYNTPCTVSGSGSGSSIDTPPSLGATCYIENTTNNSITSVFSVNIPAHGKWNFYSNGTSWFSAGNNGGEVPFDSYIGGLVGELVGNSSHYVDIEQVSIYLQGSLEGSRYLGGMLGKGQYLNVKDSYVSGVLKSYTETDGNETTGRGKVYMGGVGGYLSNTNVDRTLLAVYHSPRLAGDTYDGSISGNNGATVTTTNYLNGIAPLGLVQPVEGAESAALAVDSMNLNKADSSDLFASNFNTYFNGPSPPTIPGTQGDDYINVLDGSCYNRDASKWNLGDCKTWILLKDDEGYDTPRLAWEVAKQAKVPYLRRECSGLYGNIRSGNGSAINPTSICSFEQLKDMDGSGNYYYSLKKSLVGDATYANLDNLHFLDSGIYHLEGNGYSISNLNFIFSSTLSGNYGMFKELQAGSSLSNLNFSFIGFHPPSAVTITGVVKMGILAGVNNGSLSNIRFEDTRMDLVAPNLNASYSALFGGLVGLNETSGVLQNIQSNIALTMTRPSPNSSTLEVGGLVGTNNGTINGVRINGELARVLGEMRDPNPAVANLNESYPCSSHPGVYLKNLYSGGGSTNGDYFCGSSGIWTAISRISANETWGGAVGVNYGRLSEIQYEGSMRIRDFIDNTYGVIAPLVGKNIDDNSMTNSGFLTDIKYNGHFDSNKALVPSLIGQQTNGTYARLITSPNHHEGWGVYSSNFVFPSGTSNITESICAIDSPPDDSCYSRNLITSTYSDNGLTFNLNSGGTLSPILGLSDMTDWNISTGFLPDMTKTWKLHGNDLPDLMKGDGEFSDNGKGF